MNVSTRFFIAVFLVMAFAPAQADVSTARQFSEWMMQYHQHPTPSSITPNIKKAAELGVFKEPRRSWAVVGFIAGAIKSNPALPKELVENLANMDDAQYGLILMGIWYGDLPNNQSRSIVYRELEKRPKMLDKYSSISTEPNDMLEVQPKKGPWVLDAMWGYFFATGDKKAALKIISALQWLNEGMKNDLKQLGKKGSYLIATGGAAKWSLISNSKQDERVLEICREQIPLQRYFIATQLVDIVAKATKG